MAWNLHAVEQAQWQGQHRAGGVGRLQLLDSTQAEEIEKKALAKGDREKW